MPRRLFPSVTRYHARTLILLAGLPALSARGAEPLAVTLAGETPLPISLVLAADAVPTTVPGTRVVEPGAATATPLVPTAAPPPPVIRPRKGPTDTSALAGEERAPVSPAGTPTVPSGAGPEAVPLPYTVTLNGANVGDAVLLQLRDGRLLARQDDLVRWHLSPPPGTPFTLQNQLYYVLDSLPGYQASLDAANQRATLTFGPAAFNLTRLSTTSIGQTIARKPQSLGALLNYSLLGTRIEGFGSRTTDTVSAFGEAAVFDSWGVLNTTFAATNLVNDDNDFGNANRRLVRLESALTRDDPATLRSLIVGDTISGAGLLSRPVRLGGVRYTRNFTTQPGFITYPQPTLSGSAALPSVVDVYVDGVRQQQRSIAPGPFQLDALPTTNGQGDVQLVVRDILGREQVINQSFFTGTRQLARNLSDFSYEAGFLRYNLGLKDSDYRNFTASGTQRYGFTDNFTGEGHVEFVDNGLQGASVGSVFGVTPLGVFSTAAAVSHSGDGTGVQGLLAFNRVVRRSVSFGLQYIAATPQYRSAGLDPHVGLPSRQISATTSVSLNSLGLGTIGNIGLGYFNIQARGNYLSGATNSGSLSETTSRAPGRTTEFYTLFYTAGYRGLSTTLLLTRRVQPDADFLVQLRGLVPLGGRRYGTANIAESHELGGRSTGTAAVGFQSGRDGDFGLNYAVEVRKSHGDFADDEVQVNANGDYYGENASVIAAVNHSANGNAYRAGISGTIGTFAGHTFITRPVVSSFAVVETGVSGLDLTVQGQPAGRTDADGVAVLPRIQAYYPNRIQVDSSNLPLDVTVPNDSVDATPYYRSGLLVSLPARITHSALLTLRQKNGRPVPAGAVFTVGETTDPVGRNGQVYLNSVEVGSSVGVATWAGKRCTVRVTLPANASFQQDLGTLTCEENTP